MNSLWNEQEGSREGAPLPEPEKGPDRDREENKKGRIVRAAQSEEALALHRKKMRRVWAGIVIKTLIASVFAFLFLMPIFSAMIVPMAWSEAVDRLITKLSVLGSRL